MSSILQRLISGGECITDSVLAELEAQMRALENTNADKPASDKKPPADDEPTTDNNPATDDEPTTYDKLTTANLVTDDATQPETQAQSKRMEAESAASRDIIKEYLCCVAFSLSIGNDITRVTLEDEAVVEATAWCSEA